MKDIENSVPSEAADALKRLHEAVARLERAASTREAAATPEVASLRQQTEALARRHAALKKSAGQVAVRLDATLSRLAEFMSTAD